MARIKRSHISADGKEVNNENKPVIYEDVSLERGAFLVQQAMRAFCAQNIESAKARLELCVEDIREQLEESADKPELCSQLGAILGMLGDCCRASGDAASAVSYFEESVKILSKLPNEDAELTHTLSVSLNKIGDLKYYDGNLEAARSYYYRSLDVRRNAMKNNPNVPSQTLDVAVSLAKVADVNRGIGNEDAAVSGFQEALSLLESFKVNSDEQALEQRARFSPLLCRIVVASRSSLGSNGNSFFVFTGVFQYLSFSKLRLLRNSQDQLLDVMAHYFTTQKEQATRCTFKVRLDREWLLG